MLSSQLSILIVVRPLKHKLIRSKKVVHLLFNIKTRQSYESARTFLFVLVRCRQKHFGRPNIRFLHHGTEPSYDLSGRNMEIIPPVTIRTILLPGHPENKSDYQCCGLEASANALEQFFEGFPSIVMIFSSRQSIFVHRKSKITKRRAVSFASIQLNG